MESMLLKYIEKKQKFQFLGLHRYQEIQKKNLIKVYLHRAKKISTNFKEDFKFIRNKFLKAGFPLPFNNSVIKDFIYQNQRFHLPESKISSTRKTLYSKTAKNS